MQTMYPAKVNSPTTMLAGGINAVVDIIPVFNSSVLPAAPNLAAIGTDEDTETILYLTVNGNNLENVTRGFQGVAKSWPSGTQVARFITAYDHDAFKANIETHDTKLGGIEDGATADQTKADIDALGLSHDSLVNVSTDDHHTKYTDAEAKAQAEAAKLDDHAVPDDNTDLNASAAKHGLMPKADKSKLDGVEASAVALATVKADADVADAIAKKHTQNTDTALGAVGTKDPPIDADKALYRDSTAADALVTSTWTQIKAFLKTYFDTIYRLATANHSHQSAGAQAGKLDHGLALNGLGHDDHPQYIKHSLATAISDFLVASGAGVFVKQTLAQVKTLLNWAADIAAHAALTTGIHGVSGTVVGTSDTQTLTNKTMYDNSNIQERIISWTTTSTPIPTGEDLRNVFIITALVSDASFQVPSGTPANCNKIIIRIKDNGTARALSWDAIYRAVEFALPTTTTPGKTIYLRFIYNSADSKWDMVAINVDAVDKTHLSQDFGASGVRLRNLIVEPISGVTLQISNAAQSAFSGVINAGGTGGLTATNVPYDGDSNEDMFNGLLSGAGYWGRIILHNTTRGNSRKIVSVDRTNDAITTESSTDDWADDDVITCQSQTNATSRYFDVDVSAEVPATTDAIFLSVVMRDNEGADDIARQLYFHTYEAYDAGKRQYISTILASDQNSFTIPLRIVDQKFTMRINTGCEDVVFVLNVVAEVEYADT